MHVYHHKLHQIALHQCYDKAYHYLKMASLRETLMQERQLIAMISVQNNGSMTDLYMPSYSAQ